MTPDDIALVQKSFEKAAPFADTAAGLFYGLSAGALQS